MYMALLGARAVVRLGPAAWEYGRSIAFGELRCSRCCWGFLSQAGTCSAWQKLIACCGANGRVFGWLAVKPRHGTCSPVSGEAESIRCLTTVCGGFVHCPALRPTLGGRLAHVQATHLLMTWTHTSRDQNGPSIPSLHSPWPGQRVSTHRPPSRSPWACKLQLVQVG